MFLVTTVATLLAVLSVPALPRAAATGLRSEYHGVVTGLRNRALTRPATIFATSTAAVGVLVTFLPLATTALPAWVVAAALLAQPAASTAARCVAGRLGDRRGHARLLTPGVLLSAAGIACLAATGTPAAVIGGALVFGLGFGVLQNATLVLMYSRAPAGGEGAVSAIWNATYDLGMAAGALAAGLLVTAVGYPATFVLTAALMLPALILIRRDQTSRHIPTLTEENAMRAVHLNMTMSLDGFIAGPHGELDWMTTAHDADLTADIVALMGGVDEAFMGYPTAAGMIRYWADVAQDPDASQASRDIAHAVSDTHTFAISRTPEQIDVPNAEVVVAPDDAALIAAVTAIKQRPGRDIGLPGGVRTARTFARLDLIDQYVLLIEPIAIGTGQRLFDQRTALDLVEVKAYECGIVRVIYQPSR